MDIKKNYNGEKYAVVQCHFKGDDMGFSSIVKLNTVIEPKRDDNIFFYFNGINELVSAVGNESKEDFIIDEVIEFINNF